MYICLCKGIRETEFEGIVIRNGGYADRVKQTMGLDEQCCGRCETNLEEMIQDTGIGGVSAPETVPTTMASGG